VRTCTKCGWTFRPEGKATVCRSCWGGTPEATAEPRHVPRMDISGDPDLQQLVTALVGMAGGSTEDA
jgi:hypothetical protein